MDIFDHFSIALWYKKVLKQKMVCKRQNKAEGV